MSLLTALALSIGALGGIATFLFLTPTIGMGAQIWAAFIAWACFYHCGGKEAGLKTTIISNIFGAFMAWIALMLVVNIPLGGTLGVPLWAGICVGVTVFALVLAANMPAFSAIPAVVYGYASTAAFALLATKLDTLTAPTMQNPLIAIVVSMVIGALFGYLSEKLAGMLVAPQPARA